MMTMIEGMAIGERIGELRGEFATVRNIAAGAVLVALGLLWLASFRRGDYLDPVPDDGPCCQECADAAAAAPPPAVPELAVVSA